MIHAGASEGFDADSPSTASTPLGPAFFGSSLELEVDRDAWGLGFGWRFQTQGLEGYAGCGEGVAHGFGSGLSELQSTFYRNLLGRYVALQQGFVVGVERCFVSI
jgi:hypothetical protein